VRKEARALQAKALLATAENAESFQNYREAIATYEKAAKLDPAEGLVFHRLGMLLQRVENDPRRALHLLRTAVTKSPDSVQFRLDLGDLYGELEMALNARREFQEVLKLDKKNTRAKNSLRALR
jgi:Flp pilus assembly protein TadD